MLEVNNAAASYSTARIISDISLKVNAGEIRAVLGRNGVGKSTLMKYIAGTVPNERGEVRLDGERLPVSPSRRARAGIGYVPQGREIFPRLTTAENIELAARACGHNSRREVERMFELFPMLKERASVMGQSLSGGQQQILAIARALATHAKLLILDEPTEGVQPSIIDQIHDILHELNADSGVAMLIAEQNLDFVTGLASTCYIMDKGQLVREMATEDLRADKNLAQELLAV